MKLLLKVVLSILFLGWLGFLSCQKEKEVMYNKLPVANAGHDLIIVLPNTGLFSSMTATENQGNAQE